MTKSKLSSYPSSSRSSMVRVSTVQETTPDWTYLPNQLFPLIAKRLNTRIDTLRFRAICNLFQSSVPPPTSPLSPLSSLEIPFPVVRKRCPRGHFVLTQFTTYAIEPLEEIPDTHNTTKTWFLRVEESNSGLVKVEDPISGIRLNQLSKTKLPESLKLLDYRIQEINKVYRLKLIAHSKVTSRRFNSREPPFFEKVVCSSSLDETGDDFSIMAMYNGGKLGVWRNVDKKWIDVEMGRKFIIVDIIYRNDKFYALGYTGLVLTVDPVALTITQLLDPGRDMRFGVGIRYLVQSLDDLFVVIKVERNFIKVYKLDQKKLKWVRVLDGLDDRVFFLSEDGSYSVSAKEFSGCKANCIYFADEYIYRRSQMDGRPSRPGKKVCIFDLKDGVAGRLSDFPGYSKIFWPPPTWLKENPALPDGMYDYVSSDDDSD